MGVKVEVQEIRVTAGVFGDDDESPLLYLGKCEGSEHLGGLVELMTLTMLREVPDRTQADHFWSATTTWVEVEPSVGGD